MRLTFLEAEVPSTKTFMLENGELKKIGHPRVIDYLSHWEEVDTIEEFHDRLVEHADKGHCLLKGNTTRELHWESRRGSTDPNESTQWVCFDVDGMKDVATPSEFMELIGYADVDRVEQYSASSGIVEGRGLSCHIFVLIDKDEAAPLLKQRLIQLNLTNARLRSALGLTRTNNALRWTLDVSTCQNDKLIYIAPPILGEGVKDGFKGKRIRLVKGKRRSITFDKAPSTELNRKEMHKALNALREAAGLEARKSDSLRHQGTIEYLAKPDRATVTGVRQERGFVYLNLNGGDSWGYYHPESNPEFIFNFKGEPNYRTRELLPDYWTEVREKVNGPKEDEEGNVYLAFRDFRSSIYWNGIFWRKEKRLEIAQARGTGQLHDFLKQHDQPIGDFVPDWDVSYDPSGSYLVDQKAQPRPRVNMYQASPLENTKPRKVQRLPEMFGRVLLHALGDDEEARDHFVHWAACIVQLKASTRVAWVLHGVPGTGKGLLFEVVLRPIIGHTNALMKRMRDLDGQFNGFLENCLLLWVDEAEAKAFKDSGSMNADFKNYIKADEISIRHMHQTSRGAKNYLNFIFASNKVEPIIIEPGDRRFSVGCYQHKPIDSYKGGWLTPEHVKQLKAELEDIYWYLRGYPIDASRAEQPLNNQAKQDIIRVGRTSIEIACDAVTEGDLQFFVDQKPSGPLEHLPRFKQDEAVAYCALVDKLPTMDCLSREELQCLIKYVVGDEHVGPIRFGQKVGHKGLMLRTVRRDKEVFKGVNVKWKKESGS